ncbi:aromatase/cyclase [Nocardia sp. CC227C]|uniref:aromatase/cyclase n=1 Tax=Nocardia sp. CC227C TaxID=3044562 RepID=UPI00278BFC86|nr:aromatase/cyclase [Nocardia sp. CC227C]
MHTEHSVVVAASASSLYRLVSNPVWWPSIFAPCVHVRQLDRDAVTERFQLWAIVNDEVKTWTSRRRFDAGGLRIEFEQESSQAPIASMGGVWEFRQLAGDRCEVVLGHHFTAVDGDRTALDWITQGVDANSEGELAALARLVESRCPLDEVIFSFEDRVQVHGDVAGAYEFIARSDRWSTRLAHVRRVDLIEAPGGIQWMEMDTVTADGAAHTTKSVRLCFPRKHIVYKQLLPPELLIGHSGTWEFESAGGSVVVTARHRVAVDADAVPRLLGSAATLVDAGNYLREKLGANSRATLAAAAASEGVV